MVLKPVLTVEGKEYEVRSLSFDDGVVKDATVMDEHKKIVDYYSIDCKYSFVEQHMKVDFSTALKFVGVEEKIASDNEKLIAHLDEMHEREYKNLIHMALNMAQTKEELPFEKLGEKLVKAKKNYDVAEQRVLGIIDTIEEVKAYTEGYYANGNDAEVEA